MKYLYAFHSDNIDQPKLLFLFFFITPGVKFSVGTLIFHYNACYIFVHDIIIDLFVYYFKCSHLYDTCMYLYKPIYVTLCCMSTNRCFLTYTALTRIQTYGKTRRHSFLKDFSMRRGT